MLRCDRRRLLPGRPDYGDGVKGRQRRVLMASALAALALGGCSLASVSRSDAPAPRQRVASYLSALERGDTAAAYPALCPSIRRRESADAFQKRVASTASDVGRAVSHVFLKSDELSNGLAAVKYEERTATGTVTRTATLDRDGANWCVSGIM